MAAVSLFGDTNMGAVTSCEIQELSSFDQGSLKVQPPRIGCNDKNYTYYLLVNCS